MRVYFSLIVLVVGVGLPRPGVSDSLAPPPRHALGTIVGAVWDPGRSQLHIVGDADERAAAISSQDVAVALRWAIGRSDSPGFLTIVHLEDDFEGPLMEVRVSPAAANTSFGWTMLEADRIMKSAGSGGDSITREPLRFGVRGFRSLHELSRELGDAGNGVWSRYWLQPREHQAKFDGGAIRILDAHMGVDTEIMTRQGGRLVSSGGLRDPAAQSFARFLTEHMRDIARQEPAFARLEQLFRLLLIAEWARQRSLMVDWSWVEREAIAPYLMPDRTPTLRVDLTVQTGTGSTITTVDGGVSFEQLALAGTRTNLAAWTSAVNRAARGRGGRVKRARIEGRDVAILSIPPTEEETAANLRLLAELPLQASRPLRLMGRSPWPSELAIHQASDTLIATPRLYGVNPKLATLDRAGSRMNGWSRAQEYQGVAGVAASKVPVRAYQLWGADGSRLATFSRHEVHQGSRSIVVRPDDGNSRWTVAPEGKDLARAFENPEHIFIFHVDTGLLVGEQIGGVLVRYWHNDKRVLERITFGGKHGEDVTLLTGDLGENGHLLMRLRRVDGTVVAQLAGRQNVQGPAKLSLRVSQSPQDQPIEMTLDRNTGTWISQGERGGWRDWLSPLGRKVAALLDNPGTQPALLAVGARTLVVSPDRRQLHLLDASMEDPPRVNALLQRIYPVPVAPDGPLRELIERRLPEPERKQLDRIRANLRQLSLSRPRRNRAPAPSF